MPPDWLMSISWHDWHREWFLFFHFSLEEAIPCSICSMVEKHKTCQPMLTTHQQKDVGNSPFIWVQADCIVVTKGHHFSTTKQKHISGTTSALGKMAECLPRSIKDMITLANDKPLRFAFTTVSRRSKLNWNININQPQIYICPLPVKPPSHLPLHRIPLGCHWAPDLSSLHHTANFHWLS